MFKKKNMNKFFTFLTIIIFVTASVPVASANSIEIKSIYKYIKRFSNPLSNILTFIISMTNYACDDENWNPEDKTTFDPNDIDPDNPPDREIEWEKKDRPDI